MFNMSNFAERLKELMFDDNKNAPTLAKIIGIDRTTITRYLACKKIPSLKNIVLLADYFNCSIDFLTGRENESYQKTFKTCPPFNKRLAFLFEYFDKSKADLRDEQCIPESIIFGWLRGDYIPSLYNIDKLADFFDCSIDFVIGRGD